MLKPFPVRLEDVERSRLHSGFDLGALTTITIWHDYICPWCWVALFQGKKLSEQFGVVLDWRGAELIPPGMDAPKPSPKPVNPPMEMNAPPKPPTRFDLFLQAEGIELKSPRPSFVRSHNALLGAEFVREANPKAFDAYNEGVYRAFWEDHKDISDPDVLRSIAEKAGVDGAAFVLSLQLERYAERILPFDDEAYAAGIRHAPTFLFGGAERIAEANYDDLARATERFLIRAERFKKG